MSGALEHAAILSSRLACPVIVLALVSALRVTVPVEAARGESSDAIVRKVFSAWEKRQDRIHSVRAEFVESCSVKNRVFRPPMSRSQDPVSYATTSTKTILLDFAQKCQRYQEAGEQFNTKLWKVIPIESITVLRRGERRTYTNSPAYPDMGLSPSGQGVISGSDEYSMVMGNIRPLLWYVCPLGSDLPGIGRFDLRQVLEIKGPAKTSGSGLIEFGVKGGPGGSLWVDPARDYIVVRTRSRMQETNIEYSRGDLFRFVPSAWTCVLFGPDGSISESSSCRITTLAFNESLQASDFELAFPQGTRVHHAGAARATPTMIATSSGNLRPMLPKESSPRRSIWRWFIYGNVLLVIVLAAYLIYRRVNTTHLREARR